MEGFKEALDKEISSAVRSMLDKGFGRFKTRYAGDLDALKEDGKQIRGRCYRVTDLKTGETDVVFLQDNGSVFGITWGESDDKRRI